MVGDPNDVETVASNLNFIHNNRNMVAGYYKSTGILVRWKKLMFHSKVRCLWKIENRLRKQIRLW